MAESSGSGMVGVILGALLVIVLLGGAFYFFQGGGAAPKGPSVTITNK